MPVLITFALPLFAVAGTVSSIASAGDHQLKLLILPKGICQVKRLLKPSL
jgi:hypothetical protein